MSEVLSGEQARRVALAAQGFSHEARRSGRRRPGEATIDRLRLLQLDSVSVFARAHYVPVFSRYGAYEQQQLDQLLWGSGEFTEYWAHEAACIRVEDRPLFAWRMREYAERYAAQLAALAPEVRRVRAQLADAGPQLVRELQPHSRQARVPRGSWWDWNDTKHAVELLFASGEVVAACRERFERRYALATDVLPAAALADVPRETAQLTLVARAARALGLATLPDLADYYRLQLAHARSAVRVLEASGVLVPVRVTGWVTARGAPIAAWMHRDVTVPNRLAPDALLTPFDPLIWFRPRTERIFNFRYRIEIYTPKHKRQYGYYCLPLMVTGRLAGRVDLKADRDRRVLLVQAAWQEPRAPQRTAAVALRLLAAAARWQGLSAVRATGVGNLELPREFDAA